MHKRGECMMKKYVFLLILIGCLCIQLLPVLADEIQVIELNTQLQTTVQIDATHTTIQLYNDSPYDIQMTHLATSQEIQCSYHDQQCLSLDQLSHILLSQILPSKQSFEIEIQTDQETTFMIEWVPVLIHGYIYEDNAQQAIAQKQIKVDLWNQNGLIETTYTDEKGYYQFQWSDYSQYEIKIPQYQSTYSVSINDITQYHDFHFTPLTYYLHYDLNGGNMQSSLPQKSYLPETSITLLSHYDLSYDGYYFVEWNEAKDGTGIAYRDNDLFKMPAHDVTLYAIWQKVAGQSVKNDFHSKTTITKKPKTNHVKTSDETSITIFILLCLASLSIMIVLKVLKKKENR